MGKKPANYIKKKKVVISFDEEARKDYLTGFQKRRQQRKDKALEDLDLKLKHKIRAERNKRRKETKEKVETLLKGVGLFDENDDDIADHPDAETVDFGTHEVIVKSGLDFSETTLQPSHKESSERKKPQNNLKVQQEKKVSKWKSYNAKSKGNRVEKTYKRKSR